MSGNQYVERRMPNIYVSSDLNLTLYLYQQNLYECISLLYVTLFTEMKPSTFIIVAKSCIDLLSVPSLEAKNPGCQSSGLYCIFQDQELEQRFLHPVFYVSALGLKGMSM